MKVYIYHMLTEIIVIYYCKNYIKTNTYRISYNNCTKILIIERKTIKHYIISNRFYETDYMMIFKISNKYNFYKYYPIWYWFK